MTTKHNQIIEYIESLPVGEKISVRSIAKNLNMSEGTAYRAIKDAENSGLVSTIERVGTIRIERKTKTNIERLTYGQICKIIDGEVFGGAKGLNKVLNRFVIGAMTEDAMIKYIQPESLMIIGNREIAQELALKNGAAVLITGGFKATAELVDIANTLEIPIIGTSYDTFSVATMINRAMTDQLIKKKVMLVDDIYTHLSKTDYLTVEDTVVQYHHLTENTHHSRFPVINNVGRLVGMITAKDIIGKPDQAFIERLMTKNPTVTKTHTSVANVAHLMIWNGLEMLPVVQDNMELLGIITRQDVMKAMQLAQRQPQIGHTIEDEVADNLIVFDNEQQSQPIGHFSFNVTPQMTNSMGMMSFGVLSELISLATKEYCFVHYKKTSVIDQMSLHFFKMVQIDSKIDVQVEPMDIGRKNAKIEVNILLENSIVAKAIISCQLMERT